MTVAWYTELDEGQPIFRGTMKVKMPAPRYKKLVGCMFFYNEVEFTTAPLTGSVRPDL